MSVSLVVYKIQTL